MKLTTPNTKIEICGKKNNANHNGTAAPTPKNNLTYNNS